MCCDPMVRVPFIATKYKIDANGCALTVLARSSAGVTVSRREVLAVAVLLTVNAAKVARQGEGLLC